MKRLSLTVLTLALLSCQTIGFAACGYVPTVELRNTGFNHVKGDYDQITLYCTQGFITVKTDNNSRQEAKLAPEMLKDGVQGACWLSATSAGNGTAPNAAPKKVLSFAARYDCKNKDENAWGKVSVLGKVQYAPGVLCTRSVFSCFKMQGQGVLVAVGMEPLTKGSTQMRTCVCPVTPF